MPLPRLVITPGAPNGIGPEVTAKALHDAALRSQAHITVVGDEKSIKAAFEQWGPADILQVYKPGNPIQEDSILLYDVHKWEPEQKDVAPEASAIAHGARGCLAKRYDAIVTGPISKKRLADFGFPHPGHTQFLGEITGVKDPVMSFVAPNLRVSLVSNHIPLNAVSQAITEESLLYTISVCDRELKRLYGIERPRLAICGLNPHAGEGGLLGIEELDTLIPAIKRAQNLGYDISGPIPSDSVFGQAIDGKYDLVIALYHDQGLIPIKLLGRGASVHLTFGLPIIRTSVDHGTAEDIAGQGIANAEGMVSAIKEAIHIVNTMA